MKQIQMIFVYPVLTKAQIWIPYAVRIAPRCSVPCGQDLLDPYQIWTTTAHCLPQHLRLMATEQKQQKETSGSYVFHFLF
jgi:hypothetical protein